MDVSIGSEQFVVRACSSFFSQFRGWMFRLSLPHDGLFFIFSSEKHIILHMFFVFRSLDIVFISSDMKVVCVKKHVKPFTPFLCGNGKYILEVLDCRSVCPGDLVQIK